MARFCFVVCVLLVGFPAAAQDMVAVIPEPVSLDLAGGFYRSGTLIVTVPEPGLEVEAVLADFSREWLAVMGRRLVYSVARGAADDSSEGYHLTVSADGMRISAFSGAGVFYAVQTLRQLMPSSAKPSRPTPGIPCVKIVDYPRYTYRGMHLDVSRHFFGVAFIKKYLDILAAYKLNVFHWHLTDSHGWRIEIRKYPRLTSVGAWRANRPGVPMTIAEPTARGEAATYGGYYTQVEVREIVAYAAKRYITIVPEIEIPGHCTAALVAYPEFSDLDNPVPLLRPCGSPGDVQHNLCLGYEPSYRFVEDILSEVMALFPGSFIHIGGDEVRGGPWYSCPRCRERMREKGFVTARQYQDWFTHRIDSFINAHGKRMIGWDEVLEADISSGAAAMLWHNPEAALRALKKGRDMVMAPYRYTYFDFYQSDPRLEPNITYAWLGLDSVYAFEPLLPGLTAAEQRHVLGGEACLWTENFVTPADVEYMLLPRMLALAEVLWTPASGKDYARFVRKTEAHFVRFRGAGLHFATSLYNVAIRPAADAGGVRVALSSDVDGIYPIHYTLDGSAPTALSPVYAGPVRVAEAADLRARVFVRGVPVGKENEDRFTLGLARGAAVHLSSDAAAGADAAVGDDAAARLADGIHGTVEPYDGRWVVFHDNIVDVVVDLGRVQAVHGFDIGCMEDQIGDMFLPASVEVGSSVDGVQYRRVFYQENNKIPAELDRHMVHFQREALSVSGRYLKFTFRNAGLSPDAQKNLFVIDELIVR